jgi:FixJ family two-component response regulator
MLGADTTPIPMVFVVDDDVSIRESLELLISDAGWSPKVFSSACDFLESPLPNAPRCLILDVGLPDLNGLDVQRCLAAEQRYMPIIFITGNGDVPTTVRAMKAGASEFLTKPFADDVLLTAIGQALGNSRIALEQEVQTAMRRSAYAALTHREREVMALVTEGKLNKQIAQDLHISEVTVKAHRGSVMRKMSAESLADLVRMSSILALQSATDPLEHGY